MNIKFLTFLVGAWAALSASAGTLYWQINNNPHPDAGKVYVAVAAKTDGGVTYLDLLNSDGGASIGKVASIDNAQKYVQYADVTGFPSDASIYLELFYWSVGDESATAGYVAEAGALSTMSAYVSDGSITSGDVSVWIGTATIPEPTSGLLLLMGGALLALRRRRRSI